MANIPHVRRTRTSHASRTTHAGVNERSTHADGGPEIAVNSGEQQSTQQDSRDGLIAHESQLAERVISGSKLQVDSIATEHIQVGATVTNVQNEGATVIIDDQGILIHDGNLIVEDEFGSTTYTSSGPDGAWEDQALTGIKNGAFSSNLTASMGSVPSGRTATIPYWTVTFTNSAQAQSAAGFVKSKVDAAGETVKLTSDKIRVRQGVRYHVSLVEWVSDQSGGGGTSLVSVKRYSASGLEDTLDLDTKTYSAIVNKHWRNAGSFHTFIGALENPDAAIIEVEIVYTITRIGMLQTDIFEIQLQEEPIQNQNVTNIGFPAFPSAGAREYKADADMWFVYDGTRWLCECAHSYPLDFWGGTPGTPITATTGAYRRGAVPWLPTGVADLYLLKYNVSFYVSGGGSALSASHKWVGQLTGLQRDTNATQTNLGSTVDVDFGDSAEVRNFALTLNIDLNGGTLHDIFSTNWTKTGTPGAFQAYESVEFRYKGS